ncbi:gamma-glutamylcyclotransferase family protein [Paenibacillus cremeus]|uniref:Gamma-glutamylcyclotransferase n=1 Tax=Paenibacillus cremeus TaxID=2163881 RepID=A0A559JNP2_9BACL|nr:gamma-glutamylcyclotransferase family protein [Paenibacillus cremeus]TVY01496.1 gamma-glutamylcyclotransferase [Paenibacillus cremeus]
MATNKRPYKNEENPYKSRIYPAAVDGNRIASKEVISCYTYVMPETRKEQLSYTSELIPDGFWPLRNEPLTCLYLAYGSCMSRASFSETVSTFDLIGAVSIPDYRVGFTHYSKIKWGGGVADLLPAKGQQAEGVLYRIPIDQVPSVDAREGADLDRPIYRRIPITVYRDQIPIAAFTYEVINKRSEEYPPHPDYMETILDGADILTPGYVNSLIAHVQSISPVPAMKGGR